jgi:rRNA pseudouridine-1189 N-methylase Emg1 (Nep1/Mra1 family)
VPNSVFEDHAGSKVRRPAQFTYLSAYNLSLKELGQLVNSTYIDSHISYCIMVGGFGEGEALAGV